MSAFLISGLKLFRGGKPGIDEVSRPPKPSGDTRPETRGRPRFLFVVTHWVLQLPGAGPVAQVLGEHSSPPTPPQVQLRSHCGSSSQARSRHLSGARGLSPESLLLVCIQSKMFDGIFSEPLELSDTQSVD